MLGEYTLTDENYTFQSPLALMRSFLTYIVHCCADKDKNNAPACVPPPGA